MKSTFAGFVVGVVFSVVGVVFYLTRLMPVKTAGGPVPFEWMIAHSAVHHAIGSDADKASPLPLDGANLAAGAHIYREQCGVCHGDLGRPPSATAKGMFPDPPQLLPPQTGVTDDPVGETYWKVRNGIRMTGMPGYGATLSDTEIWQVSMLLAHANQLPPPAVDILKR